MEESNLFLMGVALWDAVIMQLEICVDSVESAIAAASGGAERIELCSALSEEGITPSAGLISAVRAAVDIQLFVIVRPRGGNFVYSDDELDVMRRDIEELKARGVDGVALGVLTSEDVVDVLRTKELIELARPLQVTFHRAFDVCKDMHRALEDVIACGADRLLTSGGKSDAVKGMNTIAALQQNAGDRIRIMAGGGIRISNVRHVALRTGIREVHTSLSTQVRSTACDGGAEVNRLQGGFVRFLVRENDVRAFKSALHAISLED
jgi:copper homeostasis protein